MAHVSWLAQVLRYNRYLFRGAPPLLDSFLAWYSREIRHCDLSEKQRRFSYGNALSVHSKLGHLREMGRVHNAIAAWESHMGSPPVPATLDDDKLRGGLPVTFRLSPENGFDTDVAPKDVRYSNTPRANTFQRVPEFKPSAPVESVTFGSSDLSPASRTQLSTDSTGGKSGKREFITSSRSCEPSLTPDYPPRDRELRENRNISVPDYKDDIWIDVHGRGLQVSGSRPRPMRAIAPLNYSSMSRNVEESAPEFSERTTWDSLGDVADSTNSSDSGVADSADSSDSSFEIILGSHLNSSLDRSENECLDPDDNFENSHEISDFISSRSQGPSPSSALVGRPLQDLCGKHSSSPVSRRLEEILSPRAIFAKRRLPLCAVIGAETLLGSHVMEALLLTRSHHIKALVTSDKVPEHFSGLASDVLSIVLIGGLSEASSRIVLSDALCNAETVVDCTEVDLSNVRLRQVADTILESARGLVAALDHPNSSVKRLIYCGSDLAVWDPRELSLNSTTIEPELDENNWFAIMSDDRKLSHAEAHGRTAAEMYLWTRAAGDRVPYSMCSVIPSLVLGPVLSTTHAFTAGPLVRHRERPHECFERSTHSLL